MDLTPTQSPAPAGRLLLVDDEENILRSIKRVLRRGNWEIEIALDGEQGLERFRSFDPAVVISDFRMPGMDGVELLSRVKELAPNTQRILLTGQADQRAIEDAINRSEIYRFVSKPWNDQQLVMTVAAAFEQYALRRENERLLELTREQNAELLHLNAELEQRVVLRTHAIAHAKREWELCFDSIRTPLAVVRWDRTLLRANVAAAKLRGHAIAEVSHRPSCHAFLFGKDAACPGCPLGPAMESRAPQRAEIESAGRTFVASVYPMESERQVVCSYEDVTGERDMNRRLLESEKMAAVGQLAGGVAHEINNPLGGILAFAQLMRRDPGRSQADQESLALIEESAVRCKRIVESLLRFSRRGGPDERRPFDVSRCAEDATSLFRAQAKGAPRARLEVELSPSLPPVHGDPAQLGQALLSVLQNAFQALPGQEGSIRVETGRASGTEVFVRVSDTGTGIAPEHLPHIFEPSFTTKPPGEGTGLGLAIAYRIVQDHGGAFDVQTAVGKGSTFTIRLPVPSLPA